MVIRRTKRGEYALFSLKTGKRLGVYHDRQAAENRERQIAYFKRIGRK